MDKSFASLCWIFWGGSEVPGVFIYALAHEPASVPIAGETNKMIQLDEIVPLGQWSVSCFSMRLNEGSSDAEVISQLLQVMKEVTDAGAACVWIGGEDSTWNPGVLNPSMAYGNVIAAAVDGLGAVWNSSDQGFEYLGQRVLEVLWARLMDLGVPPDLGDA